MADKRINELTTATLTGDYSLIVDKATDSESKKVTVNELKQFINSSGVDYASGATYTWPLAADYTGVTYVVKSTYSGTCTVSMQGSETMDGVSSFELVEGEAITGLSDGTNWAVI